MLDSLDINIIFTYGIFYIEFKTVIGKWTLASEKVQPLCELQPLSELKPL